MKQIKSGGLFWFISLLSCCTCVIASSNPVNADNNESSLIAPTVIRIKTTGYTPKPVSDHSRKGEQLFKDLNCMACHSIHNTGGRIGSVLDGIGAHRSESYIYNFLVDRQTKENQSDVLSLKSSLSYHPKLQMESAKLIADFLVTVPEPPGGFVVTPHVHRILNEKPKSNLAFKPRIALTKSEEGKAIYHDLGCVACHSINKVGGWLGPPLDGIGGRHDRNYIIQHITNPGLIAKESQNKETIPPEMQSFNLSAQQLEKITNYLLSLPNEK